MRTHRLFAAATALLLLLLCARGSKGSHPQQGGLSAVVPYAWEWLYGQLDPCDYRVVMELRSEDDIPKNKKPIYYISADFSVNA